MLFRSSGNLTYVQHSQLGSAGVFTPQGTAYVEIPHQPQYVFSSSFAIAFWYKHATPSTSGGERLLEKHFPAHHNYGETWEINHESDNYVYFYRDWPSSPSNYETLCPLLITDTNWHHLTYAYSYTENKFRGYLDGSLIAEATPSHPMVPIDTTLPLLLMKAYPGSGSQFKDGNGYLDEVRIYNRALSESEIRHLYFGTTSQQSQMAVQFNPVVTGRTYTPQFSTNLTLDSWLPLAGYAGPFTNGEYVTIVDTNAVGPQKFYRIRISLP